MKISYISHHKLDGKVLKGNQVCGDIDVNDILEFSIFALDNSTVGSTFRNQIKNSENFIQSSFVTFDYDHEEASYEELEECLSEYNFSILNTQSHQCWKGTDAPCNRFRLIVPLESPVNNIESYQATYDAIEKIIIPPNDRCMRSGVQYMFKHKEIQICEKGKRNFSPIHLKPSIKTLIKVKNESNQFERLFLECVVESNPDIIKEMFSDTKYNAIFSLCIQFRNNGVSEKSAREYIFNCINPDKSHQEKYNKAISGAYKIKKEVHNFTFKKESLLERIKALRKQLFKSF
jgi:hypothetical protein